MDDNTPVIIGVGEASERIDATGYEALSPADLAGRAAAAALADAGAVDHLAAHIRVIAAIRQFEVSGPRAVAPFGRADNFPRAVARRVGADPARAILEPVGGQGPQHLVNEFAQAIGAGAADLVLLCGSEAISTVRHLTGRGESRDWSETIGGELEDRGFGEALMTADLPRHGARTPISVYAMFENARRARLGLNRADYALEMGRLFAPFTRGRRRQSPRDVARRPFGRGSRHGHRLEPSDLRSLPAPDGGPRPGQPGRGGAAGLGRARRARWACRRTAGSICTAAPTPASATPMERSTCRAGPGLRDGGPPGAGRRRGWAGPDRRLRLLQLLPNRRVQYPRRPGTSRRTIRGR